MDEREPSRQLAGALGKIPSGLFIVTARRGDQESGMLASWVQQCSFEPPQITLAVKRGRDITHWLEPDAFFTVNILDAGQTDMIGHFGRGFDLDEPAFVDVDVERLEDGGPVLTDALAYLVCRVAGRFPAGDHELFLGTVVGGKLLSGDQPMVHVRKSGFHY